MYIPRFWLILCQSQSIEIIFVLLLEPVLVLGHQLNHVNPWFWLISCQSQSFEVIFHLGLEPMLVLER